MHIKTYNTELFIKIMQYVVFFSVKIVPTLSYENHMASINYETLKAKKRAKFILTRRYICYMTKVLFYFIYFYFEAK